MGTTSDETVTHWFYLTPSFQMSDQRTEDFMRACPDTQMIHTDDATARALPFHLTGRIMHGALTRDIAVNVLILDHLREQIGCTATHFVIDKGGSYFPLVPVYPGDEIFVRYNYEGRVRNRGTFPLGITYAVFVPAEKGEKCVMTGAQEILAVYIKTS